MRFPGSRPVGVVLAVVFSAFFACAAAGEESAPVRTGEKAILAALEEETRFEFVDQPLAGIVEYVRNLHRIEVLVDWQALDGPGISFDPPISKSVRGVTLRSALNLLLRDYDLAWTIRDEVLWVTMDDEAELCLTTRVYDIGGFLDNSNSCEICRTDPDHFANVLKTTIEPEGWDDCGGAGHIAPLEVRGKKLLIVRQTRSGHEKVAELLKTLTEVAERRHADAAKPAPIVPDPGRREAAIVKALNEKTSIDFVRTPLSEAIDVLQDKHGVNIMLDRQSLHDVNQRVDVPVTRQIGNVTLRLALNVMLGDLDLAWTIVDEVLLITTPEEAEGYTYAQVYDVTDLARLIDPAGEPVAADFDRWIYLISGLVQPDSWESYPNICGLEYRGVRVLIVHQTREVHEEIATLLNDIRTAADKYGDDVFPVVESVVPGGS